MPYTVHTLDGQAHTYPGSHYVHVNSEGLLSVRMDVPLDRYGQPSEDPVAAAYPAGQWTHYHVEPAPYETDYSGTDAARDAQDQAEVAKGMTANAEAWATQFQSHIDAGRKAAEAQ